MTETEDKNYEIIQKDFNGNEIRFIESENDILITAEALGIGLEYKNPRISVMKLYYSHQDELEEYKGVIELVTPGGKQETTVFREMGAYLLIMFSNQPRAKDFRKWVIRVIKEIRKKGYYNERSMMIGSTEWSLQTVEVMRSILLNQKEQELKQQEQEKRIKKLEEKDRYIFVTPRTKRKLQDEVHRISNEYFDKKHYKVWNPLKTYFQVNRYEEFREEDVQKILKGFAKEYPPKFIQEIKNNTLNQKDEITPLPSKKEKRGLEALWDIVQERKKTHKEKFEPKEV